VRAEEALEAMGMAYVELLHDREALLGQLQAHAAAVNDPAVREAVRQGFAELYEFVAGASLASDEEIQAWLAHGCCSTSSRRWTPSASTPRGARAARAS